MSAEDDFKYARDYRRGTPGTWGGDQSIRDKHMFDGLVAPPIPTPKLPKAAKVTAVRPEKVRAVKPEAPPFKATNVDWAMFAIAWVVSFFIMESSLGGGSAAVVGFILGLIGLRFWRHILVVSVLGVLIWVFVHSK
jgi:hypothetical protein